MILEMSLSGFRQYKSKETIKLSKGLNLIQGGNNAGKTTILYALEYVLFGEVQGFPALIALKNFSPAINHIEVEIVYIGPDQKKYELIRRHDFKKDRAKGFFTLNRIEEDEGKTAILDSKSETKDNLQLQISAHFGFSKRMFQVIVNNAQGEHRAFLNGDRRLDILFGITASDYLATLFSRIAKDQINQGTRVIQEAEEQIKTLSERLEETLAEIEAETQKIGDIQAQIEVVKTQLQGINFTRQKTSLMSRAAQSLYDTENVIKSLKTQIDGFEKEKQDFEMKFGTLDQINEKDSNLVPVITDLSDKITTAREEQNTVENQIKEYYANHGDIKAQIERKQSQSGKAICDYCGSEIDPSRLEFDVKELKEKLSGLSEVLKQEEKNKEKLQLQEEEYRKQLEAKKLEAKELSSQKREISKIIERIEKSKSEIQEKVDSLDEIRNKVEEKKNDCLKKRDEILPEIVNMIEQLDTQKPADILWGKISSISSKIDKRIGELESERKEKGEFLKDHKINLEKAQKKEDQLKIELQKWKAKVERAESQKELGQRFQTISEGFNQFLQEQRTNLKQNLEARIQNWYTLLAAKKDFIRMEVDPTNYHLRVVPSISPNSEPVPASKYSGGGHKMLLAIAYKLSLADTLGRPSLLLIDEPTDGTDSENLQSLLDRITTLSGHFPQTLMITHHGLAQEEADSIIDVFREGAQSKIKII